VAVLVYIYIYISIFQLYHGGQFYWRRKLEDPEKTTDLPQFTDKFYHIMVHSEIYVITILTSIFFYYIRLYFTVFLLARSNTRDIPFSNIWITKKQFHAYLEILF
jgi:hypothetical protein